MADKLIENIGVLDSELRDGLVYPCLAHLLHDGHFDSDQLTDFTKRLIGHEFLLFDLDNDIEFSVLVRSFTLLQLSILVYVHNKDKVIDSDVVRELFVSFLDYFDREENLMGYKETVGWMHSIAHSADLFAQLVKVEDFKDTELKTMFAAISKKFKQKEYYFQHDEDERMVQAIMNGLERDLLDEEFLVEWVGSFGTYKKITDYPEAYYLTNNIKNFLRSLYFALLDNEKYDYLVKEIALVLKEKVGLR